MSWQPLPTGCFTGIAWGQPGAIDGWDPYLVWAEADGFSGYDDPQPQRLPIAIELVGNTTVAQLLAQVPPGALLVPDVYQAWSAQGLSYCTGRATPAFFQALQAGQLARWVVRVELGLAAAPYTRDGASPTPLPPPTASTPASPRPAAPLQGKVFALIDDSLALANTSFLAGSGRSRTAWFWRQDGVGRGQTPPALGYGHELSTTDIDAAIQANTFAGLVDEAGVYVALGLSTLGTPAPGGELGFHALDTPFSHGSHVADLAVGPYRLGARIAGFPPNPDAPPSWQPANDDASRAAIVAVQLDYDTVKDTSGGSLNVHVLDGLLYALSKCHPQQAEVVANISFGTIAGPHDGTSILEQAFGQLVAMRQGRLQITLAAGNSYQQRTHANVTLAPGQSETLHWVVLPDDTTQNFLELWIEEGCDQVTVQVTPPGGAAALPPLAIGQGGIWTQGGSQAVCALIYPRRAATGRRGTCALIAVAPTADFDVGVATAPGGSWQVTVANQGAQPATVDAYIERDDVIRGTGTGARQSHFEDLLYDTSGNPGSFVDDPTNPTPIRRSGNFNTIATGAGVSSVGGVRMSDCSWAWYSPQEPDPDASRRERPGVRKVPSAWAISDESPVLQGVNAAGSRSALPVRMAGTSDAAPQVARDLINGTTPAGCPCLPPTSAPAASSAG